MTDEERLRLAEVERMVAQLHYALLAKGADGDPPMLDRIGAVVNFAEKGEWALRWMLRIIVTLGALAAAFAAFRGELAALFQWLRR